MLKKFKEMMFAGKPYSPDSSVLREDVIAAFNCFLRRDPENAETIQHHLTECKTVGELYDLLLHSDEFLNSLLSKPRIIHSKQFIDALNAESSIFGTETLNRLVNGKKLEVDLEVGSDQLQKMLRHVEGVWSGYGETEPYWSVVTSDDYKSQNINDHLEHFFSHSEQEVDDLLTILDRNEIDISKLETCLEYGCGVGRVTQWLAPHFRQVTGVDISQNHIDVAKKHMNEAKMTNISFVKLHSIDDIKSLPKFDFLYSKIVLQHNPPPIIKIIIEQLLGKLNSHGVAFLQVPTYIEGYRFKVDEYFKMIEEQKHMEMHAIPQHKVFKIAAMHECSAVEVLRDGSGGGVDKYSCIFIFRKN